MWFKLAGATFTNNLGTMDSISKSYMMDYSGLTGLQASPGSVSYATDSTPDATITFTVKSGYVFKSGSTVTASGGASKTYTASADIAAGSSFTMALTGINNKVTFVGAAELVSGGGSSSGGTVIAYTSRQSSSGISKSTGEYTSSATGYVNIYKNIDPTKTYAATSYSPSSTSDVACVCYYTSDGTFISAESGSDWGISSVEYTMQELTVPSNASTIKLFGRTNNQEAVLYLTSTISIAEISYSSQKTSSNLNETTGEYGSSSTGYVNIYDNIDVSKTYYASGFCPNASGTAAAVCYYTSDGTFISSQDGNDFGLSSANFVKQKLTVPSTTSTIKIFAQSNETVAATLYVEQ